METYFNELATRVEGALGAGEVSTCWVSGETSDFVRFNRGKVRQAGSVRQATLRLQLVSGRRQAGAEVSLSGGLDEDAAALLGALAALRESLGDLPDDPHLLIATEPRSSRSVRPASDLDAKAMAADILEAAEGHDLVGFLASGPVFRGFASSLGQRNWHEATSFLFDWSLYHEADRAVKSSLAGFTWDARALRARVAASVERLGRLRQPARALSPGRYRAYLTPAALAEVMALVSWSGFSAKAIETKQSPLLKMKQGASLSAMVNVCENTAEGLAPAFQGEGFARPGRVPLIEGGKLAGAMIAPRTAREYSLETNGASGAEVPESLDLAPGSLPEAEALGALGTGLWIGNLWYLNFSDRVHCRMTGMTRFATFWVEGGQIVAPVGVMRFDESLFHLLGAGLEALTAEREWMPDATTYGERQTSSMRLPGALVDGLTLTL